LEIPFTVKTRLKTKRDKYWPKSYNQKYTMNSFRLSIQITTNKVKQKKIQFKESFQTKKKLIKLTNT